MPVCYCIVILTIAMIRKMVIVMINMMVITYRLLVGLEAPTQQYDFLQILIDTLKVQTKDNN